MVVACAAELGVSDATSLNSKLVAPVEGTEEGYTIRALAGYIQMLSQSRGWTEQRQIDRWRRRWMEVTLRVIASGRAEDLLQQLVTATRARLGTSARHDLWQFHAVWAAAVLRSGPCAMVDRGAPASARACRGPCAGGCAMRLWGLCGSDIPNTLAREFLRRPEFARAASAPMRWDSLGDIGAAVSSVWERAPTLSAITLRPMHANAYRVMKMQATHERRAAERARARGESGPP